MKCPYCGENDVESGKNCYVKVETGERSVKKLVCQDCADLFMDHIA